MTTKIKTTLLTAYFFFGLLTGLQAQDKYDYAIVKFVVPFNSIKPGIFVSISGKEMERIEIKKDQQKDNFSDYTPLVNYIQTMTNNGWKVINSFNDLNAISFVLERKKN